MRRLVNGVVRGVVAVSILVSLSLPVQARVFDEDAPGFDRVRDRVVKIIKRFVPRSLGDMLTVPRP